MNFKSKKIIFFLFFILFFVLISLNAAPKLKIENLNQSQRSLILKQEESSFIKTINLKNTDYSYPIKQTSDGGYILVGSSADYEPGVVIF